MGVEPTFSRLKGRVNTRKIPPRSGVKFSSVNTSEPLVRQSATSGNHIIGFIFFVNRTTGKTRAVYLYFYVLLTVHLGIILVNNQLDAQLFFWICLFQLSTCFEHPYAHHQENQVYQYDIWYMSLYVGDRLVTYIE